MSEKEWSENLTNKIGRAIQNERKKKGLSVQGLAITCANIGLPLHRDTLANLESGKRSTLTVPELVVIAEALQVAPISLIYPPVALSERVDYLPNQSLEAIEAYIKFAAIPPLFRNRWSSDRSDEASAYHFFIESLNNDLEIEELATDIDRLDPDAVAQRETLGLKMQALLTMALLLRRSIPSGHGFPPASRSLIELWRKYLSESEFLDLAGTPDFGGANSKEPGS